jgi:hypothetical protein
MHVSTAYCRDYPGVSPNGAEVSNSDASWQIARVCRTRKTGGVVAAEYPQTARSLDEADVIKAEAELRALLLHAFAVIDPAADN